jgi:hypothetical protein
LTTQCHRASRVGFSPCHTFGSGERWSDTDKALLNAQQRPHIVFNRVLTILKAVAGMEINGRHEIQFIPSHNEVTAPNELLSAASKWMAAGCDGEDEESEAFDNCAICGMGWTENGMSYEDNPPGLYREESINPLEMFWDHSVRKKNLDGAQRLARAKEIPLRDAMQLFPGKTGNSSTRCGRSAPNWTRPSRVSSRSAPEGAPFKPPWRIKEQEFWMNKAEIVLKLHEVADFHLLGAGTWPAYEESAAFIKAAKDMGLEEDVPGSPGCTRSTALGRELDVNLMAVFAGAFHVFDVPEILESRGYIEPAETYALISLDSETEAKKLVREHVLRAYLKFCNHSGLMN